MNAVDLAARRVLAVVCLSLTAGLVSMSGASFQQSAERPLTVDFYALGPDGTSVSDLQAGEVTIRVAGRVRPIRSLRLVKQGELPAADPLTPRVAPPVPFGTNSIAEIGRSFVVLIDDESFRPGREAPIRAAINNFLGSLTPKDRVSLWTAPHGGMKVNLTTNHDRVSEATRLVIGHGPDSESGSEAACRTRTSLEAMEHMVSTLAGGEGPTTVIVLTASLYGPRRDAPVTMAPGMCEIQAEHFQRIGRAAASARAHFYIVQTEDLAIRSGLASEGIAGGGFRGNENPLEGLENLAGVTGGTRLSLARAGDSALVNIARATASYYSATIDGAGSEVEGPLGLEVRTSRAGVNLRSRAMLYVPKPAGASTRTGTPAEMVKSSTFYPDLPLRAAGYSSINSGDTRVLVMAAAETVEPDVKLAAMSAALFDSEGRLTAQFNATERELSMRPSLAAMAVPEGAYRLRVAAVDTAGRAGAVDVDVTAEIVEAGPLKMSSLVLGVSRGGFQPRLQFTTEPVAIAYLDLFGGSPGVPVGAILEVAQTIDGPPLVVNRLSIEATTDPARFRATGSVPLGALPPGDYVARAIVGVEGQAFGRVVRAFRKAGQ